MPESTRTNRPPLTPLGTFGGVALLLMVALAVSGSLAGRSELAAWLSDPALKTAQPTHRAAQAAAVRVVTQSRRQSERPVPGRGFAAAARPANVPPPDHLTGPRALARTPLRPALLALPPPLG